jgi:hypothetical protein
MSRDAATKHILEWMKGGIDRALFRRVANTDELDDLTDRFESWCANEYWTPENVTMLQQVCKVVSKEIEPMLFYDREETPEWLDDIQCALNILSQRVDEGSLYFD